MRVMVLVKATEDSEKGILPTPEMFEAMGKYNEDLINAGILRAADGLKPSSQGKRIAFNVVGIKIPFQPEFLPKFMIDFFAERF